MTDEKVVQLAEKHRIAGSDGALAAIREAYDVGRRDGLEEAAKEEWVSLSEKLPEDGQIVWTFMPKVGGVFGPYLNPCTWASSVDDSLRAFILKQRPEADLSKGIFKLSSSTGWHTVDQVSHWMPRRVPSPPASISSSSNSVEGKKGDA